MASIFDKVKKFFAKDEQSKIMKEAKGMLNPTPSKVAKMDVPQLAKALEAIVAYLNKKVLKEQQANEKYKKAKSENEREKFEDKFKRNFYKQALCIHAANTYIKELIQISQLQNNNRGRNDLISVNVTVKTYKNVFNQTYKHIMKSQILLKELGLSNSIQSPATYIDELNHTTAELLQNIQNETVDTNILAPKNFSTMTVRELLADIQALANYNKKLTKNEAITFDETAQKIIQELITISESTKNERGRNDIITGISTEKTIKKLDASINKISTSISKSKIRPNVFTTWDNFKSKSIPSLKNRLVSEQQTTSK